MLNILLSGKFNFDQFGLLISDCVSADFKLARAFPKFDANWNVAQSKS
jgi:hypothetical protein